MSDSLRSPLAFGVLLELGLEHRPEFGQSDGRLLEDIQNPLSVPQAERDDGVVVRHRTLELLRKLVAAKSVNEQQYILDTHSNTTERDVAERSRTRWLLHQRWLPGMESRHTRRDFPNPATCSLAGPQAASHEPCRAELTSRSTTPSSTQARVRAVEVGVELDLREGDIGELEIEPAALRLLPWAVSAASAHVGRSSPLLRAGRGIASV